MLLKLNFEMLKFIGRGLVRGLTSKSYMMQGQTKPKKDLYGTDM